MSQPPNCQYPNQDTLEDILNMSKQNPDAVYSLNDGSYICKGKRLTKKEIEDFNYIVQYHPRAYKIIKGFAYFLHFITLGPLRKKLFKHK